MGWCWAASCRNRGQPGPRFPKRRTPSPRLVWLRRRLDEKPTSERRERDAAAEIKTGRVIMRSGESLIKATSIWEEKSEQAGHEPNEQHGGRIAERRCSGSAPARVHLWCVSPRLAGASLYN